MLSSGVIGRTKPVPSLAEPRSPTEQPHGHGTQQLPGLEVELRSARGTRARGFDRQGNRSV